MFKIKFFLNPIRDIKNWLNGMADKGYRLVSVHGFLYRFEKANKKFYYKTQFIGANPSQENQKYVNFYKEVDNYKVFRAPLNQGSIVFGKIRLRLYSRERGKIATSFGNFNKEILIVEVNKQDNIELLTDNFDIAVEYKDIRNAYLQGFLGTLCIFACIIWKISKSGMGFFMAFIVFVVCLLLIFLCMMIINTHKNYKFYSKEASVNK